MLRIQKIFFSVFLLNLLFHGVCAQEKYPLNSKWTFRHASKKDWLKAMVPGTVHTDLLENKVIEDPFYRNNEAKLQWIDKEDWEYKTSFTADDKLMKRQNIQLVFDGLDTYADIFLNGKKIISADNMFIKWSADVKPLLKNGTNELRVYFHSVSNKITPRYDSLQFKLPFRDNNPDVKYINPYTRKASYHYGWDWGPRFVTSGIWRPVYLEAWDDVKIEDLFIKQNSLTSQKAKLQAQLEVLSSSAGIRYIKITEAASQAVLIQKEISLVKGSNIINVDFEVQNPIFWWSNGLGKAHLYNFKASIGNGAQLLAEKSVRRGLRNIEIVQESNIKGRSFHVKLNGKAVFMKGSNYIPADNFMPRVNVERYDHLINTAQMSNMNMLRVWGGGIYEDQYFYDLCDEKGILIWQDFMFGSGMYPDDNALKRSIYLEAVENVKRLRNHASIALWCGDNEAAMLWGRWRKDPKKPFWNNAADSAKIINTYTEIMHAILPAAVKGYDDEKFYWSSSPQSENFSVIDKDTRKSGDTHYWGVWWGKQPFEKYNDVIGSFMSEYGFQSFPQIETVKMYALPEDYNILSEVMKTHQKSSIGNSTISYYMEKYFKVPSKFEDYLYVGQLLQADGVKTAMEAHRRNKPFCMGSLYWQLNDSWPVASWSSMDYYGRWKALQYQVKRSFEETIISSLPQGGKLDIYAITDRLTAINGNLTVTLKDFKGKALSVTNHQVTLPANGSLLVLDIDQAKLLKNVPKETSVLQIELKEGNKVIAAANHYFLLAKDLKLDVAEVSKKLVQRGNIYELTLSCQTLTRYVKVSVNDRDILFSDNYFDLVPGVPKKIIFTSKQALTANAINITSLNSVPK
ncbi:MAG: glycoside hydrolase family 2 protein [Acinetobacter sp.]|nr:MAG: glycoside hydrolase family 2 protein [Acinetobacter sp.]